MFHTVHYNILLKETNQRNAQTNIYSFTSLHLHVSVSVDHLQGACSYRVHQVNDSMEFACKAMSRMEVTVTVRDFSKAHQLLHVGLPEVKHYAKYSTLNRHTVYISYHYDNKQRF